MSRRKQVLIAVGVAGSLLVVGAVVLILAFWDRATPVSAEDVAATLDVPVVKEVPGGYGLYVYETSGFETTDALGGARHDYPDETYLTLRPGGCGTLVRWQALEQRWSEWDFCDDLAVAGWQSFNEWYGVSNHDVWSCGAPVPMAGEPGEVWEAECAKQNGTTAVNRFEVIGFETLEIGGETVETLHIRQTETQTGETDGTGVTDVWMLPGTPLMVRRTDDSTTLTQSRIGPVEHHEEYVLQLTSIVPSG